MYRNKTLLASLAFMAAGICGTAMADVKIGFSGVMSGPVGALGQDQYDGFMLGVEQRQGKLGGQPVTIFKEDDQTKPEMGNQAIRKFIEKDKVNAVVGLGFTNVLLAAVPQLTEAGIPALATNAGPAILAGPGCQPNIFALAWQSDGPAEAMGAYAQSKGFKRVYLMAPNYQAGKDMLTGFKRMFKGEIVDEVYTQLNQPDYAAEIAQLQGSGADAVFVFYSGGMGINFIKQMNQAGLLGKMPLLSVFTVDGTTLPALKGLAAGAIAGAMWDAGLDIPASKKFVAAFETKYKRTPSLYAAVGYDAASLLDVAIQKVNGKVTDKAAFVAAVKSAGKEFTSVRGPFEFNTNNMPIQNFYAFQAVKQGDKVEMKQLGVPLPMHKDAYSSKCAAK